MAGMAVLQSGVEQTITLGQRAPGSGFAGKAHWGAGRPVWTIVMNTRAEINEAFRDYRATEFGNGHGDVMTLFMAQRTGDLLKRRRVDVKSQGRLEHLHFLYDQSTGERLFRSG